MWLFGVENVYRVVTLQLVYVVSWVCFMCIFAAFHRQYGKLGKLEYNSIKQLVNNLGMFWKKLILIRMKSGFLDDNGMNYNYNILNERMVALQYVHISAS